MLKYYLLSLIVTAGCFAGEKLSWAKTEKINDTFTNSINQKLAFIPAGSFMMGSPEDEPWRTADEVLHKVTLTQSFLMGTTEVTQEEFEKIMGVTIQELMSRRRAEADKLKEKEKQKTQAMSKTERTKYTAEYKKMRNEMKYPYGPRQAPEKKRDKESQKQTAISREEVKKMLEMKKKDSAGGKVLGIGPKHPIAHVSWTEAMEFCRKLTEIEHKSGKLPKNFSYRLPTNAEWEDACRAGTSTPVFTGKQPSSDDRASIENFKKFAWFKNNSAERTHRVGQLKPNPWGLYDIYGNVSEWCLDIFDGYKAEAEVDPLNIKGKFMMRVNRGLNSHCTVTGIRSAYRKTGGPTVAFYRFFGFRIVCAPITEKTANVPDNHTNR